MAIGTTTDVLRDVVLFRDLVEGELETLARQVVRRHYTRNQLVFSQGETGDGLYIVESGQVSISRQNPDGDELIFTMSEPGDYFGDLALFDEEPRSATATAVDACTILFLSRSNFRAFLEAHPAAVIRMLQVVVAWLRRCTDLADEVALLDVRSRLARRLLHLARGGMVETGNDAPRRSFRITQQHLASMTGATRESVNKHLNGFVDEGLVRLERGQIHILDLSRLEEYSIGLR